GSEFKVSIPYRSVNENSAMRANISEVQNNHSERKKTEVVAAIEMKKNSGVLNNLFSTVSGFSLDQLNRIGNNNEDFVRIMLEKFITTAAKNTENMVSGLANGDFTKLMNAAHKSIPSYHMLGLNHLVKHLQYIERHSREGAEFAELSARLQLVHEETWKVISEIRRCLEFVKDNKAEKIIP
ncbi:MAG: Hpt domain-containing protein, partial [Bacteroidia bacterium]|nr:Hpt domain-containing protein [Bacteroidia bacterium]